MMIVPRLFSRKGGGFLRREDGSIAIETVVILPMLVWAYLAMFSIFDTFRQYSVNQKAAYVIGDMISRETVEIDNAYLDGARDLFDYLTRSNQESALRVSVLQWDEPNEKFTSDWSQTRGWVSPVTSSDVEGWSDRLPVMLDNERIVVVETWSKYDPPFRTGLEKREIRNFVFTSPRYTDKVRWKDG